MKATKKRLIRVTLFVIFLISTSVIGYKILNPGITDKSLINDFNNNKVKFIMVKDYLLTMEANQFVSYKDYDTIIEDEKAKLAAKDLFNLLGYRNFEIIVKDINSNEPATVVFMHKGTRSESYEIIYSGVEEERYGMDTQYLNDGWYYSWIGYDNVK